MSTDALSNAIRGCHGGFIWEWSDHGLRTRTPDGIQYFGYGGDFGEVVHDGNFVMDGMVLPDGTPMPSLAEFATVNAPILFRRDGQDLIITNRRHSRSTADLRFVAVVEVDGRTERELVLTVPPVEPGKARRIELPDLGPAPSGENWLTVRAELAEAEPWAPSGHVVARAQFPLSVPDPQPRRVRGPPLRPASRAAPRSPLA